MLPLFTGEFCPRDCDRAGDNGFEIVVIMCPSCDSTNTESFANCTGGDWHCVSCGHVFWMDKAKRCFGD